MDFEKEKKRLRKERKKVKKAQERGITNEAIKKKWLSNISFKDVGRIQRTFPQVIEGMPKAVGRWNADDLYRDGITGLYLEEKVDVQNN